MTFVPVLDLHFNYGLAHFNEGLFTRLIDKSQLERPKNI